MSQIRAESGTTIVTASVPEELSPIEAAIMDACNAVHEARAQGDGQTVERLGAHLSALLARYDETDAEDHPNSAWARPNQRALALSALGQTEAAIEAERIALKYADTPRRREISLGNLAERCIRLHRYDDAVAYFLNAIDVAPGSVPVMLTGAQAMFLAGHVEEADRVFQAFCGMPEQMTDDSELVAYLDHETRMREMAARMPALAELLRRRAAMLDGRLDGEVLP